MERVPVTPGLFAWNERGEGHLIGGVCSRCARRHFPAAADCPYCGAGECAPAPLATRGRLWLCTTVHNRPPGYAGEVPFGFGVVELDDGLRVITRITAPDAGMLQPGSRMRLAIVPLHADGQGREVVTYAFAPERD